MVDLVQQVLATRKYKHIDPSLIHFAAGEALKRSTKEKEQIKFIKAYLHSVYGAFWHGDVDFKRLYHQVEEFYSKEGPAASKVILRKIVERHSSTGEQLDQGKDFYELISKEIGPISSIIDLGCGLNPLLWLFLEQPATTPYYAYDIDSAEAEFINKIGALYNYSIKAEQMNLLQKLPNQTAQVAFLFKMIPTIEFEKPGRSLEIMQQIKTEYMVVTFPTRNLGIIKKNKGMKEHYQKMWQAITQGQLWHINEFELHNLLGYIVKKA